MFRRGKHWLLGLAVFAVFGCGQDVCVFNFGKCDGVNVNRNNNQQGSGIVTLSPSAGSVLAGSAVVITATGGTPPYYPGVTNDSLQAGTFTPIVPGDTSKQSFAIPAGTPAGTAKLQWKDLNGNYSNILQITVNVPNPRPR